MIVKILQWNTWFRENPNNIVKFINSVKPDIACLQEITTNFSSANLINVPELLEVKTGLNSHFVSAQDFPTDSGLASQGNLILSKFPFKLKNHLYVQNQKIDNFEDYSNEGRVITFGQIELANKTFTLATTHLSYTHRFKETPQKFVEEEKLLEFVKNYKKQFILTGDFNVIPESQLITQLQSALINLSPDFTEKTWTTKPFDYNGFVESQLNWRLDYIFGTSDIKVIGSTILNTEFSDHLPILVTVEI